MNIHELNVTCTAPYFVWHVAAMQGNCHGTRPWTSFSLMDLKIAFHDDIMRDDLERDQELDKIWDQWELAHSRQTTLLYPSCCGSSHFTSTFICPLPSSFPSSSLPLSLPPSLPLLQVCPLKSHWSYKASVNYSQWNWNLQLISLTFSQSLST